MTDTPIRPPLWQEMIDAYAEATGLTAGDMQTIAIGTAAEIRALRDRLLPEEDVIPDGDLTEQAYRSDERAGLRAILTAEADRAERGE